MPRPSPPAFRLRALSIMPTIPYTQTVTRVPLPDRPDVTIDPSFKIDIINTCTGKAGLQVSKIVDLDSFMTMCRPLRHRTREDLLYDPALWAKFTRMQLDTLPLDDRINGLYTTRRALIAKSGVPQQALHAYIPGGPKYPELQRSVTERTQYRDLHEVLADILSCQAVWYLRVLQGNPGIVEKLAARRGQDTEAWQQWNKICGGTVQYLLNTVYVVSIRRVKPKLGNCWAYFPEVEIRGCVVFEGESGSAS